MSRKFTINDLPAAAREQATRQISRQLGAGIKTVAQPERGREVPYPLSAAHTFYRAASCYAAIKPVQADKQPRDEAGGRVRFFADYEEAFNWVVSTLQAEIERLTTELGKLIFSEKPQTHPIQPAP